MRLWVDDPARDTGVGSRQGRKPFFRMGRRNVDDSTGGAGLGLSIVRDSQPRWVRCESLRDRPAGRASPSCFTAIRRDDSVTHAWQPPGTTDVILGRSITDSRGQRDAGARASATSLEVEGYKVECVREMETTDCWLEKHRPI